MLLVAGSLIGAGVLGWVARRIEARERSHRAPVADPPVT
jgi:hypothetical protein